jgi:ADP-ribosylglycohydrolase
VGRFPASPVASLIAAARQSGNVKGDIATEIAAVGYGDAAEQVVAGAILTVSQTARFEDAVFAAASQGGAADARAAVAGAFAGAAHGTAGIPQPLIDGLEGRVYVMLAAPWFYQTIQLRNAFARQNEPG